MPTNGNRRAAGATADSVGRPSDAAEPSRLAPSAQANFNKTRIAFMQRVSAPNIPAVAFKLGWLIAFKYMNCKTRVAYPAQETLARDLNLSVRHVRRLADLLQPLGLVVVPGQGRTRSSVYWIDPEKATAGAEPPKKRTPMSSFTDRKADTKSGHLVTEKADTHVPLTNKERTNKKERAARAPKKARAPPAQSLFPEGWQPADLPPDQQPDFDHFADHARTCARTCADWEAAWRNWQRKTRRMQRQEKPNGRSLLGVLNSAIDRDAAARYVPGSEGPQPITLDSIPRAAGIRSLPKG